MVFPLIAAALSYVIPEAINYFKEVSTPTPKEEDTPTFLDNIFTKKGFFTEKTEHNEPFDEFWEYYD